MVQDAKRSSLFKQIAARARIVGFGLVGALCATTAAAGVATPVQGDGYRSAEQYLRDLAANDGTSIRSMTPGEAKRFGPFEVSIAGATTNDGYYTGAIVYNNLSDKTYCFRSNGPVYAMSDAGTSVGLNVIDSEARHRSIKSFDANSYLVVYAGELDAEFLAKNTEGITGLRLMSELRVMIWPANESVPYEQGCREPPEDVLAWENDPSRPSSVTY